MKCLKMLEPYLINIIETIKNEKKYIAKKI